MGNYCGPKVRLSRSLGVPIAETPKHLNLKRNTRPGMHGFRPARRTLFGRQLLEKQKLAAYYNLRDTQFRRYLEKAAKSKTNTPEKLQELLETRLDNTIRRAGWARTIWQARQMVAHGHFYVNGRRVDKPGFGVSPGDVITVKESSKPYVKRCAESCEDVLVPGWIVVDPAKQEIIVQRLPLPEDVRLPFEVNYSMVIEYYTR